VGGFCRPLWVEHNQDASGRVCVPWSTRCAQPVREQWTLAQGCHRGRPDDTRAIGGTRRGPTRRERL